MVRAPDGRGAPRSRRRPRTRAAARRRAAAGLARSTRYRAAASAIARDETQRVYVTYGSGPTPQEITMPGKLLRGSLSALLVGIVLAPATLNAQYRNRDE